MKINKKISVTLVGDALKAYDKLNYVIGEQRKKGIEKSFEITLLRGIQRTFDLIKANPFYGDNVKKKSIPKTYVQQYDAENIFVADLPDYWRMIYTLESNEVEIISFVLDIVDHLTYDKIFKIRKRR